VIIATTTTTTMSTIATRAALGGGKDRPSHFTVQRRTSAQSDRGWRRRASGEGVVGRWSRWSAEAAEAKVAAPRSGDAIPLEAPPAAASKGSRAHGGTDDTWRASTDGRRRRSSKAGFSVLESEASPAPTVTDASVQT
jgi:hypothetical protein